MAIPKRKRRASRVEESQVRQPTIHLITYLVALIDTNRFDKAALSEYREAFRCAAKECTKRLNQIGRPVSQLERIKRSGSYGR